MNIKNLSIIIVCFFLQSLCSCEGNKREKENANKIFYLFPKQKGWLNDFEKIFQKEQVYSLEKILSDFQEKKNKQIVIVTIKSYEPYTDFQKFTVDLGNHWNLESNTILVVFSKGQRNVGLSISKNTKGISDEEAQMVVAEKIIPDFKKGNYYQGIIKGITNLNLLWNNR
jgi:uncharacterized protein